MQNQSLRTSFQRLSKTIFELNSIRIDGERYPIRRVCHQQMGIYSSQERAVAAIRTFIENWQRQDIDYRDKRSELVFPPTKKVSNRLREKLIDQYDKIE